MSKYYNFAMVASFMALWGDSFMSQSIQSSLGFAMIFTFGILHGANDLLLIQKIDQRKTSKYPKVLFYYLVLVSAGVSVFYIFPKLALSFFVIVSGYHFGEQHWVRKIGLTPDWLKFLFQLFYGLHVLFLIFIFNLQEVQHIIAAIISGQVPTVLFIYGLIITSGLMLISGIVVASIDRNFRFLVIRELFYLLVFSIIFKTASLIWGFALYFILWHSIPSMLDQIAFLYGKFDYRHAKLYVTKSFPYWIISILGIVTVYGLFKDQVIFDALFFAFLASITFPHVFVILKMFGKKAV
ncbi:MAG: hypothetical protein CFE23_15540 [Flavobacterium sp. BFFFF1]|uniref:Brp/Blh family beta-carotene 15,15'-dioxygenase n=1 Tax=Flavobacterium sp. BFFFF1 TaxID=2015557 RepID=UPI000BC66B85|nr:Brp/Blh family beta-carotene 15,15'-dioxygenase [Flavobacterium sp. BFFFF1]OYU79128.1 MAG: hypothetical protein CFE23_15540 [Flavobacterium sp. BFFFF1]